METSNNIALNRPAFSLSQSQATKTLDSLNLGPSTVKTIRSSKDCISRSTEPCNVRFGVEKLEVIHSRLNSAARTIRVAFKNMEKIENYIDRMKAELQGLIKNYPPFPPGSEERVRRLKSINAFRKLIDQLTIPPPNEEFATKIMTGRDAVLGVDDSKSLPGENKLYRKIHSHQVRTRAQGFDIPELQEDADDEEVHIFREKLDAARETFRQKRSDLAENAADIIDSYEHETESAGTRRSYGEEIKSADMEAVAELKSNELGYALAIEPGMTLTEAQTQLLSLLY
ncbi:MAG: hypothetical protein JSV50_04830 [Desulfobacteraceae bacterium]|nr:MAG: hypothetical protein JSV50_04830 [Desulfobacteraceae bacterium]